MYAQHASLASVSSVGNSNNNNRAIVSFPPSYVSPIVDHGFQMHNQQHQQQPIPSMTPSVPFVHHHHMSPPPMMSLTPASMPRALHDLLHRLHWVAGTPAEHQICYKDMSYVRRGTLYACIKRFMLGEKRDNNMEKLYSDVTDALEHLRYYYLTGNTDYVEKIANALIDIYDTLSVIGRTTYYDDRSILSRLLVIRSEIKSALASCGLAKGIMLSPQDDLQTYVMTRFLNGGGGVDQRQPSFVAPPQSPAHVAVVPSSSLSCPMQMQQQQQYPSNGMPSSMSNNQPAIHSTSPAIKESGGRRDAIIVSAPITSPAAVVGSINDSNHASHSEDMPTGNLYDSL